MNHARWQKICLSILCAVLSLILIVMVFATAYVHHLLGKMGNVSAGNDDTLSPEQMATATETMDPTYTGPTVDPGDVTINTLPSEQVPTQDDEDVINILLVGQDRKPDEPRQRSDSMILCTFNEKTNTITMTSFMRDTYVYIPGHGKDKMNAAYQWGGFTLINETLAVNFGVHVDANVEVDFGAFKDIIDMLGGVDIELTKGEAEYINTKLKSNRVSSGLQRLDGEEALWYARNRSTSTLSGVNNDFGRTERQRRLLSALVTKYKNQDLTTMLNLLEEILPKITTNMTDYEILGYAVDLFPLLAKAEMKTLRIPTDDTYDSQYVSGSGSCLIPDLEEIREILVDAGVAN